MFKENIVVFCEDCNKTAFLSLLETQYSVLDTSTIEDTWRTLDTNKTPAAILIDLTVQKPEIYALAQEISNDIRYKETPILFLCNDDKPEKKSVTYDNRRFPRLYRPLEIATILEEIQKQVIKNQKEAERKVHTVIDPLTELLKKDHFMNAATKQIDIIKQKDKKISFAMFALDNYTELCQRYSKEVTDHLLKDFAALCKGHLRPYDLIARFQEHRLVASFYDCGKEQALQVIERIKNDVEKQKFLSEKGESVVTCSAGVAEILELSTKNQESVLPDTLTIAYQRLEVATQKGGNKIES